MPLTLCLTHVLDFPSLFQKKEKVDKVEEYMKHKKLPGNLRFAIRDYYLNKFQDGKKLFNEAEMLADLSPQLKTEVRWHSSLSSHDVPACAK